jgi:hypothetical protein
MKKTGLLVLYLLSLLNVSAQTETDELPFALWASLGTGLITTGQVNGMSCGRAGLNVALYQKHFISGQFQRTFTMEGVTTDNSANQLLTSSNISLLYGRSLPWEGKATWVVSAGISAGKGVYQGQSTGYSGSGLGNPLNGMASDYESTEFVYIGFPVSVKMYRTGPETGYSLDLYANLHHHADFGLVICWEIGRIWW